MKPSAITALTSLLFLSAVASSDEHRRRENFLRCLNTFTGGGEASPISHAVYTPTNSSFNSILQFSINNLRFASKSTPKPAAIIAPDHESQVPAVVRCARQSELQIRTRSGGHDAEGRSYVSQVPFVVLDLINLSEIEVEVEEKTAWVGAGSTIGGLYYAIAARSRKLGFPAGICSSVGVGGHLSGGGYGCMLRKYGLAADNVVGARMVDVNGDILERGKGMSEDVFWAIRGGTAASFGVLLAWKVQLVDVPEKVVAFSISRTSEQNATQLIHRWQYIAPKIDHNLFLLTVISRDHSKQDAIRASFLAIFLGGVDRLLMLMNENYPELGLVREDCTEMSWIQSTVVSASWFGYPKGPLEVLRNRRGRAIPYFKSQTDYIQEPISEKGLNRIWRTLYEQEGAGAVIVLIPYGGRMDEISESSIPFPHRAGNLYSLSPMVFWGEEEDHYSHRYIEWIRRFHRTMTPYASKSPRVTYFNDRDLDLGVNNDEGDTSYDQASVWGFKYFKNNFDRLVRAKTIVDPENFFREEQSIPSLREDV
ncbi:berberine bridge enzyme-like 8 [Andrographis paniculata]|uniref:berberine bridge enzyme-like 8 n=1 Tax=Andrographis paniculata TaxID=175694 RepID=UPI0021E94CEA|nr:berberine bridge enzyme-like 8 [Andrographis paniculata]